MRIRFPLIEATLLSLVFCAVSGCGGPAANSKPNFPTKGEPPPPPKGMTQPGKTPKAP